MWIAKRNTVTHLHWDPHPNFNAQIRGKKRWILVPPADVALASPVRFGPLTLARLLRDSGRSRRDLLRPFHAVKALNAFAVDAQRPDYVAHPEFARARALECVLEPGDLLFLPVLWLHSAASVSDVTISMNWWFDVPESLVHTVRKHRVALAHYALRDQTGLS